MRSQESVRLPAEWLRLMVAVVLPVSALAWAEDATKTDVPALVLRYHPPDRAKALEAEKALKERFKEEYQKRTPAERTALASKLLKAGEEAKDDFVAQYVAWREAKDIAAGGEPNPDGA